jgi:AcrR family transcriptional regulator
MMYFVQLSISSFLMSAMQSLSPARQKRRLRLLDAAEHIFRIEGFRGSSMERIAEAAGMSKVTLYSYFADKEAVFEGVARNFADRLLVAFETALATKVPAEQRVADALVSKHLAVFDTVRRSAQAKDIFAARDRIASGIFQQLDLVLIDQLAEVLNIAETKEPKRIARLLFAASQGIANESPAPKQAEADIRLLVSAVLRG